MNVPEKKETWISRIQTKNAMRIHDAKVVFNTLVMLTLAVFVYFGFCYITNFEMVTFRPRVQIVSPVAE
jgi:hypothetical protein